MKTITLVLLLLISPLMMSQNLDELIKKTQQENSAQSWSNLTQYYYDNNADTALIGNSVRQMYALALKEGQNGQIGEALAFMATFYYSDNLTKYIETSQRALQYLNLTDQLDMQSEVVSNIGHAYNQMGKYDDAIKQFHLANSIANSMEQSDKEDATILYNISYSYLYKGNLDSTKYYLDKALLQAEITKDTLILIEGNTVMGIVHKRNGDYQNAISSYEKVVALHEKSNNKERISLILMNIANAYFDWKSLDKALYFSRESVKSAYDYSSSKFDLGRILVSHATILQENELYQEALDALRIASPLVKESDYETYISSLAISSSFAVFEKYDSCFIFLDKAEKILSTHKDFPAYRFYMNKGSLLVQLGRYNEAIPLLEAFVEVDNDSDKFFSSKEFSIYNNLAIAYEKGTKDYEKALLYKNIAFTMRDSLYKESHNMMLTDYFARYETAKKDLEISQLNEKQAKWGILVSIISVIAAIFLIIALYYRIKKLKKEKEAVILTNRIEQKDFDFQNLQKDLQNKLSKQYISGLETERKRLAKELHDGVGNDLLGIIMQINNDADKSIITDRLNDTYHNVRNLSHSLIPPVLINVTLAAVLEDFVRKHNDNSKVKMELDITSDQDCWKHLPPNYALEAYRIIQEAVNNSLKHANASTISIEALLDDSLLSVRIMDNGRGFDGNSTNKGIGIKIMKERAEHMKCELSIQSEINRGTTISFQFNIPSFS